MISYVFELKNLKWDFSKSLTIASGRVTWDKKIKSSEQIVCEQRRSVFINLSRKIFFRRAETLSK